MQIRSAIAADAPQIAEIYNHFIATSHATFEIDAISVDEMETRIGDTLQRGYPFLVCEDGDVIVGYTYGRQYRPRRAYQHTIEVAIYIKPGREHQRIGTRVYEQLIAEIRKGNFHAVVAGISLPNDASVRLHESFGFEKVAQFKEVGNKFDRWIDVGYWQLILGRSPQTKAV